MPNLNFMEYHLSIYITVFYLFILRRYTSKFSFLFFCVLSSLTLIYLLVSTRKKIVVSIISFILVKTDICASV